MKIDHVTAVVDDINRVAIVLEAILGTSSNACLRLPGMAIRSFRIGDSELHLCAATGPGPVQDHHGRHGTGYHHLALRVDDIDAALTDLERRGFPALGDPVETAPGLREVFLDGSTTGGLLIQIVERKGQGDTAYELDSAALEQLEDRLR